MSRVYHDDCAWRFWRHLLVKHPAAREVGIPGGRIDVVRLDADDRWVELYDIKVVAHTAARGVAQLERYAEIVGGEPALTVVCQEETVTDALLREAEGRARVLVVDFTTLDTAERGNGNYRDFPWLVRAAA